MVMMEVMMEVEGFSSWSLVTCWFPVSVWLVVAVTLSHY